MVVSGMYIHCHPEVDSKGVYKEHVRAPSKIIFYLIQDGCMYTYKTQHPCRKLDRYIVYTSHSDGELA